MEAILKEIAAAKQRGEALVMASIVSDSGSTPRGAGAKMLVLEGGSSFDTIGGGAVEYAAQQAAKEVLREGRSRLVEFDLSSSAAAGLGMICGGRTTVFLQYIAPTSAAHKAYEQALTALQNRNSFALLTELSDAAEARVWLLAPGTGGGAPFGYDGIDESKTSLHEAEGRRYLIDPFPYAGRALVFGMGHVGAKLAFLLQWLGFYTLAMDDRPEFLTPAHLPTVSERELVDFTAAVPALEVRWEDYIVILTRGHQHDYNVLRQALKTPARYIGMIGSRNKVHMSFEKLRAEGFTEADIARISAPIGLDLGGDSPEEIAVSIAAEMIRVRTGYREKPNCC